MSNTPQAQPAPTKAQIEQQLTQVVLQRAALKDQLEAIEKQMPVLHGVLQLLTAQEAEAKAAAEQVKD